MVTSASFRLNLFPPVVVGGGLHSHGGLMPVPVGNAAVGPRYSGLILTGFLGALYIILCHFGTMLCTTRTSYRLLTGIRLLCNGGPTNLACVFATGIPLILLGAI